MENIMIGVEEIKKSDFRNEKEYLKAYNKAWKKANREYFSTYSKQYYSKNKEKVNNRAKAWRKRDHKKYLKYRLQYNFGISLEEYERKLKEQNSKCAICGNSTNNTLNVDHCHMTNKFRGLLCSNCNTGLGLFKDNIETLQKAIEYLKNAVSSNFN